MKKEVANVTIAFSPDELPAQEEMSPEEVQTREKEKAQLLEALQAPEPKSVKAFASKRLAAARQRVDPDAIRAKLAAANTKVVTKTAEVEAAAEADRQAQAQREADLADANRQLGEAQDDERKLVEQTAGESIRQKAERFRAEGAVNRAVTSSEVDEERSAFKAQALPMLAKLEAHLLEVDDFSQAHMPSLKIMASLQWQETPSSWRMQWRLALVSRCVAPARELIDSIQGGLIGGMEILEEVRAMIAGRKPVRSAVLVKLREHSRRQIQSYVSRLAVLNTDVDRCERAAKLHSTPGYKPSVVMRSRPVAQPTSGGTVKTEWDPHE